MGKACNFRHRVCRCRRRFQSCRAEVRFEDAAALGAKRLSRCGDDPDFGRMTANVAALCDLAGSVGMGVDVENMGWRQVRRFEDALALAKATGRDICGALVDALHFYRNGGVPKMLANSINRVRSLQLCDLSGPGPDTDAGRIAKRVAAAPHRVRQLDLIGLVRDRPRRDGFSGSADRYRNRTRNASQAAPCKHPSRPRSSRRLAVFRLARRLAEKPRLPM